MTIYFAGPLFTHAEITWNAARAEELRALGYTVLLPQEFETGVALGAPEWARAVFEMDRNNVAECDVVLAILDGSDADSGTCWECGYTYAHGKPVIGYRTDIRATGDEGGLNLMLSQSCTQLHQEWHHVLEALQMYA